MFLFLLQSLRSCIDASMQSSMLANYFPISFLDTQSLLILSHGCISLGTVVNFLVILSSFLNSPLLYFKNGPKCFTRRTAPLFIPVMIFLFFAFLRYINIRGLFNGEASLQYNSSVNLSPLLGVKECSCLYKGICPKLKVLT